MTKAETAKLIAVIVMAYPNFDKFKDEGHIKLVADMWADIFIDDNGGLVEMAVRKHISVSKWPPSIAEIREIMAEIKNPDLIPPDEAWTAVANAMYAIGEFCHEDLSHYLPPLVLQAVEAVGYHTLYEQYRKHTGYDRVAFKDIYEPLYRREKETAMLSPSLQKKFNLASQKFTDDGRAKLAISAEAKRAKQDYYDNWGQRNRERLLALTQEQNLLTEGNEDE